MSKKIVIFYVPFPNQKSAHQFALELLESKLVACAQYVPIKSIYKWDKKIEKANETVLILKSLKKKKKQIEKYLLKNHPYEVPCIISSNVDVNATYYKWVKASLD